MPDKPPSFQEKVTIDPTLAARIEESKRVSKAARDLGRLKESLKMVETKKKWY